MPDFDRAAFAFLSTRRSHPAKLFAGPVPDRAALEPILQAALRVPDHGKLEPWRMIVLGRKALIRLADLAEARGRTLGGDAVMIGKGRGQYDLSQLAVVVISSPKASDKVPVSEQVQSASALCMGLVNAGEAAGWGANWLSGWPVYDRGFIEAGFQCTLAETVAGIVHIGTPGADGPDRPRPDLAQVVAWVDQ